MLEASLNSWHLKELVFYSVWIIGFLIFIFCYEVTGFINKEILGQTVIVEIFKLLQTELRSFFLLASVDLSFIFFMNYNFCLYPKLDLSLSFEQFLDLFLVRDKKK